MRAIRLTKAEVAVLESIDLAAVDPTPAWRSLMAKVRNAQTPSSGGVQVALIQAALITAARGKVVALVTGYPIASRRCGQMGVTVPDARLVGEWMARQHWLRGPQTLLDVLNKWPQWLSKARATEPPPQLKEGFGADAGQGADGEGQGASPGRPASGFR